ncbi:MAG TPA: CrpP-related protein [Burkholderiaceae bacterium]|nr:CrpP-related protein [Burkholderiaceae bacterium]
MKRTFTPPRPADVSPALQPGLSSAERAELQRQGAKAAARGEPTDTNPFSQQQNKPPATGESAAKWSQRNDAWEEGYEAQSATQRHVEPPVQKGDDDEYD